MTHNAAGLREFQVCVLGRLAEHERRRIADQFPNLRLVEPGSGPCQVVLAWELDVPGMLSQLQQQPDLEWLHLRWAGVPRDVIAAMDGHPAVLTNGSGAHGVAVAEFVLAVILAHFKRLHQLRGAQREATWLNAVGLRELRGSSVGIIGLGDLGGSIARALRPLGVAVRGLRRSATDCPDVEAIYQPDQLARFLQGLDVLVIAAPLTAETTAMIGHAELARLAPGALLVNVGRGPIVDEAALIAALQHGPLEAAALDVFEIEPLPSASPLWRMPNVFISPHCCDATPQSKERGLAILLDNLARFSAGQPLRNVVDRRRGY